MTDKEMIKAIECCLKSPVDCDNCAYTKYPVRDCNTILKNDIADLINRQQAEIDRLTNYNRCIDAQCRDLLDKEEKAKAEAIKEFAEKLKAEHSTPDILMPFNWISIEDTALDQLVAEMVGAE